MTGQTLRAVAGTAGALASMVAALAGAFYLTSYLYGVVGERPSPLLGQVVNTFLGLLLLSGAVTVVTRVFRSRIHADRRGTFGPIVEAMERIAKGDFEVRIANDLQSNRLLGDLVSGVNNMAVELSQMERMRQEFISDVSHEIQSPLTSIRGFAEALESDDLGAEDRHHYLTVIETESLRLSRITENLLRLASLESDHAKFEPAAYRLDRQIRTLILACEPQWTGKGIEIDVALEDVTITADEDLLSQVWINLINNAVKFTPQGGTVSVALHRHGNQVEVEVADTGIGIPEADQARVFERFYKADRSRQRSGEGSGLGLAIARKVVEMHRGTIRLQSCVGTGSTFTVSLPLDR